MVMDQCFMQMVIFTGENGSMVRNKAEDCRYIKTEAFSTKGSGKMIKNMEMANCWNLLGPIIKDSLNMAKKMEKGNSMISLRKKCSVKSIKVVFKNSTDK